MHYQFKIGKQSVSFFLCFITLLLLATEAFAADVAYQPLVGLPQVGGTGQGLAAYFNRLYIATIALGAILAFIKISVAGVKWSMSDVVTDKGEAKKDIQGALLGLGILLIPFIVLNTIYGGLTNLNVLERAGSVGIAPAATGPGAGSGNTQTAPVQYPKGTVQIECSSSGTLSLPGSGSTGECAATCSSWGGTLIISGTTKTCIFNGMGPGGPLVEGTTAYLCAPGEAQKPGMWGSWPCKPVPISSPSTASQPVGVSAPHTGAPVGA